MTYSIVVDAPSNVVEIHVHVRILEIVKNGIFGKNGTLPFIR